MLRYNAKNPPPPSPQTGIPFEDQKKNGFHYYKP